MSRSEFIQAAMNVGKWSKREPWLERFSMAADLHLKPAEENLGIDPESVDEMLGESRGQMLKAYILEDFCSLKFEEEKFNVIDAYLEQHGWRESVRGKRYLEALRNSVASLYEIVKVAPDGAVTVEDRLRDDEPVVLEKERMLEDLNQGDYMAGRIVAINGDPWLANGTLSFPSEVVPLILETFDRLFEEYARTYPGPSGPGKEGETIESDGRAVRDSLLSSPGPAAMLSWFWLSQACDEGMFLESDPEGEEEGASLSVEVAFPIQAGEGEIAGILNTMEGLEREKEGRFWLWVHPDPSAPDRSKSTNGHLGQPGRGGDRLLGMVGIEDGKLFLETDSQELAERGRDLLTFHLGDRLGRPRFSTWDPGDLEEKLIGRPIASPVHPDYGKAIMNLGEWVAREPWRKIFYAVLREHLDAAEGFFGLDEDEIYALLGDHDKQMLNIFILEDFYTTDSEEDRHGNIISAYLEKQGQHESVHGRCYLEATRASTASLYEIGEFDPDQGVAIRDRLRDGDPVFVPEDLMLGSLSPGDCLAARLITVDGKSCLTFGQLHIASERLPEILGALDEVIDSTAKPEKSRLGRWRRRKPGRTKIPFGNRSFPHERLAWCCRSFG